MRAQRVYKRDPPPTAFLDSSWGVRENLVEGDY